MDSGSTPTVIHIAGIWKGVWPKLFLWKLESPTSLEMDMYKPSNVWLCE